MVKLTAELIEQSAQYTNPVRDRELDLRGKYPNIHFDLLPFARPLSFSLRSNKNHSQWTLVRAVYSFRIR